MNRRLLELLFGVGAVIAFGYWLYGQFGPEDPPLIERDRSSAEERLSADQEDPVKLAEETAPIQEALPLPKQGGFTPQDQQAMKSIHVKFNTGDFLGALKLADGYEEAGNLSPAFYRWLRAQMPALLTSAGWIRLKLGDCDDGMAYLTRAVAMQRLPETIKGLAICHWKRRQVAAAIAEMEWYLQQRPDDLSMRWTYADALESESRFEEAIAQLERITAGQQGADDPDINPEVLAERLKTMRGRAKESQHQIWETSRYYRLTYRIGDHEDLVSFTLDTLERAADRMLDQFGFRPPSGQIEVVLYPADSFRGNVVGGPEWAKGLYDGRIRIPVDEATAAGGRRSSLANVLKHEASHAFLSAMTDFRQIPSWFDEGLAQLLACEQDLCKPFQFPITPGEFLDVDSFNTPYISFPSAKAGRAYRQSRYLMLTMIDMVGIDAVRRVLAEVTTSSVLSADAMLRPLEMSFADLHTEAKRRWEDRRDFSN